MKYFLIFSLLSSTAFAMDFNKVTGTFEVGPKKEFLDESDSTILTGTFANQEATRLPASAPVEVKAKDTHVTEITGSFK